MILVAYLEDCTTLSIDAESLLLVLCPMQWKRTKNKN